MKITNIFKRIVSIFKRKKEEPDQDEIKHTNFVNKIIPSLKFGDIIFAERFNNDIEKDEMGEGHQTGPYVVLGFDDDRVIGAYCTSKGRANHLMKLGEEKNYINADIETFVDLQHTKTIDSYAFVFDTNKSLNAADIKRIKKRITQNVGIHYNDFGLIKHKVFNFNQKFDEGDIVCNNDNCYIIVKVLPKHKYELLRIDNHNIVYPIIDFSKVKIDYFNPVEMEQYLLNYKNSIIAKQTKIVIDKYNDYKNREKSITKAKEKTLERGCLVEFNKQTYYVYGIEGNKANTFKVVQNNNVNFHILITDIKYNPYFNESLDIDIKNDNYKVLAVASEKEIDDIREKKKGYFKRRPYLNKVTETKPVFKNNKDTGSIVCLRNDITSRYIIIDIVKNKYKVISLNTLVNKNLIMEYELDKKLFRPDKNITSIELNVIKRKLIELGNEELSMEVEKKNTR